MKRQGVVPGPWKKKKEWRGSPDRSVNISWMNRTILQWRNALIFLSSLPPSLRSPLDAPLSQIQLEARRQKSLWDGPQRSASQGRERATVDQQGKAKDIQHPRQGNKLSLTQGINVTDTHGRKQTKAHVLLPKPPRLFLLLLISFKEQNVSLRYFLFCNRVWKYWNVSWALTNEN